MDPRNYQIALPGTFKFIGIALPGFQISLVTAAAIVISALLTQMILFARRQEKSALISSMSLISLLRTDAAPRAVLASVIAIASKRFIRYDGSDLFNPSALALVLITTFSSHAYIFPGAWGALGMAALILFGIGLLLFAFVTTADSKTTPVHFSVRMVFAVSVALLVALLHFKFYLSTAAIYALVVLAPLVTYFKYLHKEYI